MSTAPPEVAILQPAALTRSREWHDAARKQQNLLCAYLAATVLVGLLGNELFEWWWLGAVG